MEKELLLGWQTTKDIIDGFFVHLPNIVIGIIVYCLFANLSGIFRKVIVRIGEHARLDITLVHALGVLSSATMTVIGVLMAALIIVPGFKVTHVIAGLGVTSIAVGFAFKDILENF